MIKEHLYTIVSNLFSLSTIKEVTIKLKTEELDAISKYGTDRELDVFKSIN